MTREEAKQKFDNFGKSFTLEEARLDTHILIDQIYDAHEAELKAKDERIEAQSSVIIACQNTILQKDERIIELEEGVKNSAEIYAKQLAAKDKEIVELEAMLQNMCAECECAKFADNAIKPSEMWKLHTMLKGCK